MDKKEELAQFEQDINSIIQRKYNKIILPLRRLREIDFIRFKQAVRYAHQLDQFESKRGMKALREMKKRSWNKHYIKNREKLLAYSNQYRKEHREELRNKAKQMRQLRSWLSEVKKIMELKK